MSQELSKGVTDRKRSALCVLAAFRQRGGEVATAVDRFVEPDLDADDERTASSSVSTASSRRASTGWSKRTSWSTPSSTADPAPLL